MEPKTESDSRHRVKGSPGLWLPWMADYAAEVLRVHDLNVKFGCCGGGWYALFVEGEDGCRLTRLRSIGVRRLTHQMKRLPNFMNPDAIETAAEAAAFAESFDPA